MRRSNPFPKRRVQVARATRAERIAHAESLGFIRCEPYAVIGVKRPRWFKDGGYYDFAELPELPAKT